MRRYLCLLTAVLMLVFWAPYLLSAAKDDKSSAGTSAAKDEKTYVGTKTCRLCHEPQTKSLSRSLHWKQGIKNSPLADKGCETCHGPGSTHVRAGGGAVKDLITFTRHERPEDKSRVCLNCHENSPSISAWDSSLHKKNDVSCEDCHTIHTNSRLNLKKPQPGMCTSCHKEQRSQLTRQSHHPIAEGKVKCTDCHSTHGGFGRHMLIADSVPDLCYTCHAEKKGPYAFEHPPVVENCSTCHQSHGSNHNGLLTSKVPQLCQGCHNIGAGHTSRAYTKQHGFLGEATANKNKYFARGCLNCHGNVHGSNRSPMFLR